MSTVKKEKKSKKATSPVKLIAQSGAETVFDVGAQVIEYKSEGGKSKYAIQGTTDNGAKKIFRFIGKDQADEFKRKNVHVVSKEPKPKKPSPRSNDDCDHRRQVWNPKTERCVSKKANLKGVQKFISKDAFDSYLKNKKIKSSDRRSVDKYCETRKTPVRDIEEKDWESFFRRPSPKKRVSKK